MPEGAGESGKSTILKQMKLIYASGFSKSDRDSYRCIIFSNILNSLRTLFLAMEASGLAFEIEENEVAFSLALSFVFSSRLGAKVNFC
jgi:guanine nucleotide-binding protein subunit alpha